MIFDVKNRINCYLEEDGKKSGLVFNPHTTFTVTPIAVLKIRMFPNIKYDLDIGAALVHYPSRQFSRLTMSIINLTSDEHHNLLRHLMTEIITLDADMDIIRNIRN